MILLFLLLIDTGRIEQHVAVDLIEINHYYSDGKLAYTQIIFYEWAPDYRRWHVIRWQLLEKLHQYPIRRGEWVYCLGVKSKLLRETWTVTDPERENKDLFPEECRGPGKLNREIVRPMVLR